MVTRGRCSSKVGDSIELGNPPQVDRKGVNDAREDLGTGSEEGTKPRLQNRKGEQRHWSHLRGWTVSVV